MTGGGKDFSRGWPGCGLVMPWTLVGGNPTQGFRVRPAQLYFRREAFGLPSDVTALAKQGAPTRD
jgi:hypothetical protein